MKTKKIKAGIVGKYEFKIWKSGDYFIAKGKTTANKLGLMITQGRNEVEIFEMIADAFMTILDVPPLTPKRRK